MSDDRWLRWGFMHEQTGRAAVFYYRDRHKPRQRPRRAVEQTPAVPSVGEIAAAENLLRVYYQLQARAGAAPGADGLTYAALARREVPGLMRVLSRELNGGSYRPRPGRKVPVPKAGGGHRTLTLRDLCDRVVASALNTALVPVWETVFHPASMAFRPRRGVWRMLAELERVVAGQGRWLLATDDVRKAFDNVAVDDVMDDHRRHVKDDALLRLVEAVLRGSADEARERGIDQGSADSPAALNLLLHHRLDLGFTGVDPPWFRYADNLVYLCREAAEGDRALAKAGQLLGQVGLELKGEDGPPRDLWKGEKAQLLGFSLVRQEGRLRFDLGEQAWEKLNRALVRANESTDPPRTAGTAIEGWAGGYAPAFESLRGEDLDRILRTATQNGFRESCSPGELRRWCRDAWGNWRAFRERAQQNHRPERKP